MSFQSIVLTIATIILIICLIVLGILMWNSRNELSAFPPEIGNCPDYFVMKEHNGKDMCYNEKGLGNGGDDCMWGDFGNTKRDKKEWAESCGLTWDGVTNM